MKAIHRKKSTRGRRPGHLGKAHKPIHDEVFAQWQKTPKTDRINLTPEQVEEWRHNALANRGNYPPEVERTAFILGQLTAQYGQISEYDRQFLKMNRREIKIPLPYLPRGERFDKSETMQCLHGSGHDVIWVLNFLGYYEAFLLLGYLIRAAVNKDTKFFKELARRVESSIAMEVPLTAGVELAYLALASLKYKYLTQKQNNSAGAEKLTPLLEPVFRLSPGNRPPLTLAQIHEYVWVFGKVRMSDRALSRAAKLLGIPVANRGRRKSGT